MPSLVLPSLRKISSLFTMQSLHLFNFSLSIILFTSLVFALIGSWKQYSFQTQSLPKLEKWETPACSRLVWGSWTADQGPVWLTIHNITTCASCGALFRKQWSKAKGTLEFYCAIHWQPQSSTTVLVDQLQVHVFKAVLWRKPHLSYRNHFTT